MNNQIKRGLKINLFITITISIFGFVLNKTFSKYMGVETLGLMNLFTQIIAYLNLADLGVGMASSYALYKPLAEKNEYRIAVVISTIDYFYKKVSFVIIVFGLSINLILHKFIETNTYGYMLYLYWSLYVLNTAISYLYAKYPILFTANQEFNIVRIIQGTGKVLFQIFQILILIKFQSFTIFIILMICENIYLYQMYKSYYKKKYRITLVNEKDKSLIKDTKNLFWHKVAGVIVFNTDYIILSKYVSLAIVGVYSSYLMVYQMLIVLIGIISNVLTPNIGKYVAEKTKEEIYKKWYELYKIYNIISTFLVICTYYLIVPFVKLWLGQEYLLSKITIMLIMINLFIQMTRGVTETFKITSGFFDDVYSPFLEGVLNLIFSLILVKTIGLNGVIIGTLISNVVVIIILKPILVFKRCFNQLILNYFKVFFKNIFLSIFSWILVEICIRILKLDLENIINWKSWILMAFVIALLSLIFTGILFLSQKDNRKILKKIKE